MRKLQYVCVNVLGRGKMALTYRQNEILQYLKARKYAKIHELANGLHVSEATIRRELTEMKMLGLLERNHGGAIILETTQEVNMSVRQESNIEDKRATAAIALPKLPNFKTVFIDNSSTAFYLALQMDFRHKTVVTNGLVLALELSKREDVNVVVPGGTLNGDFFSGSYTTRSISNMYFNLMICSCAGITKSGTSEKSIEQSELKRQALLNSTNKVLLVGKTKFGNNEMYGTVPLSEFNAIFTNADDDTIAPYKEMKGVNIFNK